MYLLLYVLSAASFLYSFFLLIRLIEDAFNRNVMWGLCSLLFPIGTFFYCYKYWSELKQKFLLMSGLLVFSCIVTAF